MRRDSKRRARAPAPSHRLRRTRKRDQLDPVGAASSTDKEIRAGAYWDGRLDDWLETLQSGNKDPKRQILQDWSFPTNKLRDAYLATIEGRNDAEVRLLLNLFLFDATTFGGDNFQLEMLMDATPTEHAQLMKVPYYQRLLRAAMSRQPMYPGNRWILDLLPRFPKAAIEALEAYMLAHAIFLPDGRISGLSDAMAVIRARYIGRPTTAETKRLALFDLSSRDFERLVERLYAEMGYKTKLTPARRDGGRDVLATRGTPAHKEHLRIECKLYREPVGVRPARELLGVVTHEKVNKGVLVTSSRFTRGATTFSESNPRLELITGSDLVVLMNEYLGSEWSSHVDSLLTESRRRHP